MTTTGPRVSTCSFGPLVVEYDERLLEPRPWTLIQSEWAAELAAAAAPGPILELCAGAGHIGLAAAVLADRELVQVEADPTAAGYAVANAARAGRRDRVEVRTGRLQSAVRAHERFAVIIADPPYLPSSDVALWPADPVAAIDGGADGMRLVEDCLRVAADHLLEGGQVLLQVAGPPQTDRVTAFVDATPELRLRCAETRVVDEARAVVRLTR